ncbi:MAG: peptidase U32 [Halobacteriovoraceae bacterium]|nr:peptidase U32 [Halobacteriovoraceae bacterium]
MNKKIETPELLAPAGNLDKLKVAINYGANAVYLGGLKFGLRSAADNFTYEELREGVEFAHSHNALVYVVLNGFLHDQDLAELVEFVQFLDEIKIDAVIVSDLGVIQTVKKHSNIEVHLSTQASCVNSASAKLWKKMGVTRIVLGREVSLAEAKKIKDATDIEIEMFVHGSMCMAYSGNCVISNFTQGRDSNRGGCAHSCRFEYSLDFQENDMESRKSFFMSSKDLNGLKVLEEYIKAGIDSIKVEGRMKSHLYVASISKIYSEALRYYQQHGHFLSEKLAEWDQELKKFKHRTYTEASLMKPADRDSIFDERETTEVCDYKMVGRVIQSSQDLGTIIEVRNGFNQNDWVEFLPFTTKPIKYQMEQLQLLSGDEVTRTNPSTLVKLPFITGVESNNLIRMS